MIPERSMMIGCSKREKTDKHIGIESLAKKVFQYSLFCSSSSVYFQKQKCFAVEKIGIEGLRQMSHLNYCMLKLTVIGLLADIPVQFTHVC